MTANKGRVHLAFGEEITLNGSGGDDAVKEVVDKVDAQIWSLYRPWESNQMAHSLLTQGTGDPHTPCAKAFLDLMESQVEELIAMGMPMAPVREALLQMYAQPVFNARRAGVHHPAPKSQGKA